MNLKYLKANVRCTNNVLTKQIMDNIKEEGMDFMATTNITMRMDTVIKAQL